MEPSREEQLSNALATLNELIALTRGFDLDETAQFLAMAKLNLLIDLNGITEEEFHVLCVAVEDGDMDEGQRRRGRLRRKRVAAESPPRGNWRGQDALAALRASTHAKQ